MEDDQPQHRTDAFVEPIGTMQLHLVDDEDVLSPETQQAIEALATPIAWFLTVVLVLFWMKRTLRRGHAGVAEARAQGRGRVR